MASKKTRTIVEIVQEYLAGGRAELPVFDRTSTRLLEMLREREFDIMAVERLVVCDPALTSSLLRMSNSTFYGGLEKVVTVRDAIVRLGIKQVANLVIMSGQKRNYELRSPGLQRLSKGLWRHSVGCAIGTQWLAQKLRIEGVIDNAFLAGLLHDIGKLFLLRVVDDIMQSRRYRFRPTEALVIDLLQSMHAAQGYDLMCRWNIPEVYCNVVRDHHLEELDEGDQLLLCTRLVDHACNRLGIGLAGEVPVELATLPEARALCCTEVVCAELEIRLEDALKLA